MDGLRPLFAKPLLLLGAPDPLPSRERSQAMVPTELAKKLLVECARPGCSSVSTWTRASSGSLGAPWPRAGSGGPAIHELRLRQGP